MVSEVVAAPDDKDSRIVRAVARRLRHNRDRFYWEDLEQIAQIAVWKAKPRFDPTKGSWENFIWTVAYNAIVSARRRLDIEWVPTYAVLPIEPVEQAPVYEDSIYEVLNRYKESWRPSTFRMLKEVLEGKTKLQVARENGITHQALTARFKTAGRQIGIFDPKRRKRSDSPTWARTGSK